MPVFSNRYLLTFFFLIATTLCLIVGAAKAQDKPHTYSEWSIHHLENRVVEIDSKLEQLASLSLRSGVGAVGYRSITYSTAKQRETIQIDLKSKQQVDEIVLVPCIWRDSKSGFRADGFPVAFHILAGSDDNPEGSVIATFTKEDNILPRIAPLVIPCDGIEASWIRLETTVLSPRAWDGKYILQLFEIFVFNQTENIALLQPVTTLSPDINSGESRDKRFLVDGFVPYLMDASAGDQSLAFVSTIDIGEQPALSIDLAKPYPLSRLHLHATEISDTVPQSYSNDFGMPRKILVEGANLADFSDAVKLIEFKMKSIYDTGNIIMRNFPETTCQYVRVTALEPFKTKTHLKSGSQIGFAEIELFSKGKNIALGHNFTGPFEVDSVNRSYKTLTDGRNLYGNILPIRDWLNELSERHSLETERPLILAEIDLRYSLQSTNFKYLMWLVAILTIATISAILIGRTLRMRQISNIRLRLAADLHDELGANMHTIGLLSDLASETTNDQEELATLHRRIRSETERSGTAVRHCTNMLEADGLYTDLKEDMARASRRIMAKLKHDITFEGETHLKQLKQQTRVDLYLFYKECLVNISRHADATQFKTQLIAGRKQVSLTISDNGRGVHEGIGSIPKSLQRRAKLLKATVSVDSQENKGTSINLILPVRNRGYLKNIKS